MSKIFPSTMLLLGLLVQGCSVSMQDYARDGDWQAAGYQDGIQGKFSRSYQELASYGKVDKASYDQGYLQGLNDYCNPAYAYQIGLSGSYYQGVCEGTPEAQKFRMEWQRGWNDGQ